MPLTEVESSVADIRGGNSHYTEIAIYEYSYSESATVATVCY